MTRPLTLEQRLLSDNPPDELDHLEIARVGLMAGGHAGHEPSFSPHLFTFTTEGRQLTYYRWVEPDGTTRYLTHAKLQAEGHAP